MHITIEHFSGQYPSFNVSLHSKQGSEAFISIKGCKIVNGQNGAFVSYPSRKNEQTGKYWNHVWGSEAFNAEVLRIAQEGATAAPPPRQAAPAPRQAPPPQRAPAPQGSGFDDFDDSGIPF